jgi:hypothetical protein
MRRLTVTVAAAAAIPALLASRGQGREPFLQSRATCMAAAAYAVRHDFHSRGVNLDKSAADFARDNPSFCRNALVYEDGWPAPSLAARILDGPVFVYVDYASWVDSAPPERNGLIVVVTRWGYVGNPD